MFTAFEINPNDDTPRWRAYEVHRPDAFGYEVVQYGVREEYDDGATRFIHNALLNTIEEAEQLAARFNINARKGMTYDNTMKQWR